MSDFWKTAAATFVGGATAVGLVAIPTFVWLPREFDELDAKISAAVEAAQAAEAASEATLDSIEAAVIASQDAGNRITRLSDAMSQHSAKPLLPARIVASSMAWSTLRNSSTSEDFYQAYASAYSIEGTKLFLDSLPQDISTKLIDNDLLTSFSHSDFGDFDVFYVEPAQFGELTKAEQDIILENLERYDINLQFVTRNDDAR